MAPFARAEGMLDDPASVPSRVDLWTRTLDAIEFDRLQDVATEIDWVIKRTLSGNTWPSTTCR